MLTQLIAAGLGWFLVFGACLFMVTLLAFLSESVVWPVSGRWLLLISLLGLAIFTSIFMWGLTILFGNNFLAPIAYALSPLSIGLGLFFVGLAVSIIQIFLDFTIWRAKGEKR